MRDGAAHVYDFLQNKVPGADARDQGYWREVGTIDSYFEAHMVGVDKEHDRARGFVVSAGGITVVGKGQVVAP